MVDTKNFAVALAAVAVSSTIVFAVGAAFLAGKYAGVWAAVTVGGFLFASIAMVLLYAFGEMENGGRDEQRRF